MPNTQTVPFYIKTRRAFSPIREYAWILTVLIGIGGQFFPRLGLLVPFIMLALMGMSMFKGKYWCGNFCPHGSFFDNLLQPFSRNVKIPDLLKTRLIVAAVLIYFMYNLGRRFIHVFEAPETAELLDRMGLTFSTTYLMVLLVGGLLAVTVNARTWCHFCPMGTFQTLFYKLGKALAVAKNADCKVTVTHPAFCHSCGKCARVCPMQLNPYTSFRDGNQLEDENCIRCNTCVNNCPADLLRLAAPQEAEHMRANASLEGFDSACYYSAEVKTVRVLKEDLREYIFKLIEPEQMIYDPGQFILVETDPSRAIYRAYTISGSSANNSEISITVKKMDNGYGTNLIFDNFFEGHPVSLKGPLGNELRVDHNGEELLFLANGIGITPFVSTVQSFFERQEKPFHGKATLIYGARYEEDLIYDDYFETIAEQNGQFNYHKLLSRPRTDKCSKGYVTGLLKTLDLSVQTKVYICGTAQMAADAREILINKGIRGENIFYESFIKSKTNFDL